MRALGWLAAAALITGCARPDATLEVRPELAAPGEPLRIVLRSRGTGPPVSAIEIRDSAGNLLARTGMAGALGVFSSPEQTRWLVPDLPSAPGDLRVVAIGTTVARALEAAAQGPSGLAPFSDDTRLFIRAGFEFQVVDALLTNFHLPRSTLLMLVAAFGGQARVLAAYHHAVAAGYRFFSYGDAMWLARAPTDVGAA